MSTLLKRYSGVTFSLRVGRGACEAGFGLPRKKVPENDDVSASVL